jgi:predicted phosphodiesterase
MTKILIVPDVHGRKFWHKAKEMIDNVDKVVFLGDYLDPYSHEGITFEDSVEEFKDILNFKEQYSDKVVLLVGNHDMHYIKTEFMNCSRLNVWRRVEIHDLFINNIDKFQLIHEVDKYLFSHAGVYLEWTKKYEITLEELFDFKKFLEKRWQTLEDVSYARGGWDKVGSCVWADIRESVQNELLPNLRHIIGHTQMESKPYITTKVACLDVRQCFILDTETDEIMEFDA